MIEPDEGFDMFGEGEEVEDLEAAQHEVARSCEDLKIHDESIKPTRQIDQALGRALGKRGGERRVETASWRIDEDHVRSFERIQGFSSDSR